MQLQRRYRIKSSYHYIPKIGRISWHSFRSLYRSSSLYMPNGINTPKVNDRIEHIIGGVLLMDDKICCAATFGNHDSR
jgi:hypothetical protein